MSFLKGTVVLLFVAGFFLSTITMDMRAVFFAACVTCLGALLSGLFVLPRLPASFDIKVPVDEVTSSIVLRGEEFNPNSSRKSIVGNVQLGDTANLWFYTFAALSGMYLIASGRYSVIVTKNFFAFEGLGIFAIFGLLACFRWLEECWRLRKGTIAVGQIISTSRLRRVVTFNFFDQQGERRGGAAQTPITAPPDNAVLVLYMPRNPDSNLATHTLRHFQVSIRTIPEAGLLVSAEQAT